jgi:hypothetical protein
VSTAILFPSGDQTGQPLFAARNVTCFCLVRSDLATHVCQNPFASGRMNATGPLHPGAVATAAGGEAVIIPRHDSGQGNHRTKDFPLHSNPPQTTAGHPPPSTMHPPRTTHQTEARTSCCTTKSPTFPARKVGL